MTDQYGALWSEDELTLALYLYCQIPFRQARSDNPDVMQLAGLLGRTPSSVARKLGNFGALDPQLARRGISGLTHYSKADRTVWDKFYQHWDLLVQESQQLLAQRAVEPDDVLEDSPITVLPTGPSEQEATVLIRRYQTFFRKAVLSSYDSSCCICGIDLPQLLIASHIIPWSKNEATRADPQNGLCLCSLHDRAFDSGLIAIHSNHKIALSPNLSRSKSKLIQLTITDFKDQHIRLPRRFLPNPEYLAWHLQNVFHA